MNKKKLFVMMLVLVLVLSLSITALAGCKDKDKDDINGYNQTSAITLEDALGTALWNTAEENNLNALKASAQLTLDVNGSKYAIKMNANLALNGSEEVNSFALSFVDANANANILNIYYSEDCVKTLGAGYNVWDDKVLVDIGSGTTAKHFGINALDISETLEAQDAVIADDELGEMGIDDTAIVGGVAGILNYFDIVKGMADGFDKKGNLKNSSLYQSEDGQTLLLRLRLDRILANAKDLLGVIDGYTDDLGLALSSSNLGAVLPDLLIDLKFKMSGVEGSNFENAILVGFEAELNVSKKDMRISRTSGGDFVRINISKDCKLGIGIDFKFGANATDYGIVPLTSNYNPYTNAINVAVQGQLELNEDIAVSLNLNGQAKQLGIPKGTYDLKFAIDADPVKLIGKSFNFKGGIDKVLATVESILEAVNYLDIEITKVNATSSDPGLIITLERLSSGTLRITLQDIRLLGNLLGNLSGEVSLNQIFDVVKGLFPSDSNTTTADGEESEDVDLSAIKALIDHMTINVNCDGNIVDVKVVNHVINDKNGAQDDGTKNPDTTINVDGKINKTDGIKLGLTIKNIFLDKNINSGNLEASLAVKDGVVTLTAKANLKLDKGNTPLPLDLVLKVTSFSYGNARTAFAA